MARTKGSKSRPGTKKPGPKPKKLVNQGRLPVNWISKSREECSFTSNSNVLTSDIPTSAPALDSIRDDASLGDLVALVDTSEILEEDISRASPESRIVEGSIDEEEWVTDDEEEADDDHSDDEANLNEDEEDISDDISENQSGSSTTAVKKKQFVHKYFLSIQSRVVEETKEDDSKLPSEYRRGTFWILPPDPFFALHNPTTEILALREDESFDYDPVMLYLPKVFLWIPHLLVDDRLKCTHFNCSGKLKSNGYPKDPPARRVVDLKRNFYIMSSLYKCNNRHCKKSYSGHDSRIIRQLPLHLQQEFPAYLTHRSGISKDLGDVFRPAIQNSVGPRRFQKILRELQKLTHARLEFQYLNYINSRRANPTMQETINPPKFKEFSSYSDKDGYAGYTPTAQYLRVLYTAMINEMRHLIDKQMMVLEGRVLKGDHTFKIIKHLGRIGGSPTFLAVYTVCNEFEEIRTQLLVPTKSLNHLQFSFEKMREAYTMYGHDYPEIFFTDDVINDQGFLTSIFPSLSRDVAPLDPANIINNNCEYPILSIPENVTTSLLSTYNDIQRVFEMLLRNKPFVVGFDCEWPCDKRSGEQGKLALIQVACSKNIWLLQVSSLSELPSALVSFLEDMEIKKAGRAVNGDCKKIERDFPGIRCQGMLELASFCKERDAIGDARMGLEAICKKLLYRSLPKDEDIRISNWDSNHLSENQIIYAARDAWAGLEIFNIALTQYFPIGKLVLKPVKGIHVSLHPNNLYEAVAYGEVALQLATFDTIKVVKGRVIITIKKISKPAAYLKLHKKSLNDFGDTPFNVVVNLKDLRTYKAVDIQQTSINNDNAFVNAGSQADVIAPDNNNDVLNDLTTAESSKEDTEYDDDESVLTDNDSDNGTDNNSSNHDSGVLTRPPIPDVPIPLTSPTSVTEPTSEASITTSSIPSRVLKDAFHLMNMIRVPRRHGLANEFARKLRDAIFIVDKDDEELVKDFLKTQDKTWDMVMLQNPSWILRRVKRVIPPPSELYPVVKQLFDEYGIMRCAKTGRTLFDQEAYRQAENVLKCIARGHVSDPPGISFYFKIGSDKNNLPLYRCSRGTNSLEGGVHQNIIRKFISFGASPELADAVLSDYRLRHNIDVGSFNRHGRVHDGHYEPWLTQHILDLRASFDMEHSYNRPDVYQNAVFFESSKEVFGISPLPHKLATDLGIDLAPNEEMHNDSINISAFITSSLQKSALLTISQSTLQTKDAQYHFIAKKQQTKYPILPVHTKEERDLFRDIVEEKYKDCRPDYMAFAKVWSKHADGKHIYYKTPEHLRTYYGQYIQLRNTAVSKEINITQRERMMEVLSDTSRKRLAPAAREPSQNKVPRYRQAHIPQLSSVATNNLETTPTTPLSYNNTSFFSLYEPSSTLQQPVIIWNQNAVSTPSTSSTAISLQPSSSLSNTPLDVDNNNNNSSSSSQQQPQQLTVSSRGLRAAPESSQAPLFRVSNIVLPKYRGRNKKQ